MDAEPVGASDWDLNNPHIQDLIKNVENIGEGTDYEKTPELNLVITIAQNNDPSNYEKLSQIAPIIVYPYLTFKNVKEEMNEVGKFDTGVPILDAVKNNHVMFPDPNRYWRYDPISVPNQAEESADMLEALIQGNSLYL